MNEQSNQSLALSSVMPSTVRNLHKHKNQIYSYINLIQTGC